MQATTTVTFTSQDVSGAGTTLSAGSPDYIRCTPGASSLEVVLPVAAESVGKRFTIRNFSVSHNVLVNTAQSNGDTENTETIEGSGATLTLGPLDRITLQCVPVSSRYGWEAL